MCASSEIDQQVTRNELSLVTLSYTLAYHVCFASRRAREARSDEVDSLWINNIIHRYGPPTSAELGLRPSSFEDLPWSQW